MSSEEIKHVLDWCEAAVDKVNSPNLRAEIVKLRDSALSLGLDVQGFAERATDVAPRVRLNANR